MRSIAVGGLCAGQIINAEGSLAMGYVIEPPSVSNFMDRGPMASSEGHCQVYQKMKLTYVLANKQRQDFWFWVDPNEIKDEHDLIAALANGYRPVTWTPLR